MMAKNRALVLLVCAAVTGVVGCKKLLEAANKDDSADAAAAAPSSATTTAAAPASAAATKPAFANAGDITRYPDEKPFSDEKASVHTNMLARVSVPSGTVVGTILANKPVTKLAAHQGFVLVSFDDPKDPSRTLIGWIAQGGLAAAPAGATTATTTTTAAASAKPKGAACPAGQQSFAGLGCAVECPTDDVCKKVPGTKCQGGQTIQDPQGGTSVGRACVKAAKDDSPAKKCKAGEVLAADECAKKCDMDNPKCPAGKKCDIARFRGESGDFQTEPICQ